MEGYEGVKFNSICVEDNTPKDEKIIELIKWCKKFDELGLTPSSSGNLSFRTDKGFIISCSGTNLGFIKFDEFAEVIDCKIEDGKGKVFYKGLLDPSSEAFIHYEIYKMRPDINAIFHGHDNIVLEKKYGMEIISTEEEKPYGTLELLEQVKNLLTNSNDCNYFIWKNHGICSLGNNMEEAGSIAIEKHNEASSL